MSYTVATNTWEIPICKENQRNENMSRKRLDAILADVNNAMMIK